MSEAQIVKGSEAVLSSELRAPVVEVTLLEDRAHVVRRGRVELAAGMSRMRIGAVAPVLADKTLCASVAPAGQRSGDSSRERINDVRVRRARLVLGEDKPAERRALEDELERLTARQEQLRSRHKQLRSQQANLDKLAEATLADLSVDVSHGQAHVDGWQRLLDQVAAKELATRQQRLALEHELVELDKEIARLGQRLSATAQVSDTATAEVWVEVWVAAPGGYDIQIDYIVPGACWRPYHRAQLEERAQGQESVLHFTSEGCVWQNTGEDWTDVDLVFSTERPSLGMEPPQLASDTLYVQRKSDVVVVEAREQEVQTTGLGAEPRQQRSEDLPGIDDGGEVLALRALAKATVPSDGRPYRVPLLTFQAPTTTEHVLMPELAEAVILKSKSVNRAQQPLLAGPVDLVRGGGFVGRTSILYIASGESFALGWGPDGAIRVQRTIEQEKEDRGIMSSWTAQAHLVRVRISNLGPEPRRIHMTERVPVSEIEKLKIEVDAAATTDKGKPDSNGLVHWKVELPAFGRKTIELKYIVRKHSDVVGI